MFLTQIINLIDPAKQHGGNNSAQLVERQSAVREDECSSSKPDQHSEF